MSYRIGSFNVRNLSQGASSKRDLDMMADIIREYDVIALQEVLSAGKVVTGESTQAYEYSLKYRLGDNWDMCWLDPRTDSKWYPLLDHDSRGEGYAFLWRTDKFVCPRNSYGKEVKPRIFRQYRTDKSKGEIKLIRDPGYGRFQLVNMPNAEIRLITTHIVFGKPSEKQLKQTIDYGSHILRQNEFNVLARSIYTSISEDHNDVNCVVPYTILLGDYNMNLLESGAGAPIVPAVMVIDSNKNIVSTTNVVDEDGFYRIYTQQIDRTTINQDANDFANNYDHFSYDERTKERFVSVPPKRMEIVSKIGDLKSYKEKISDHIPVILEVDLK